MVDVKEVDAVFIHYVISGKQRFGVRSLFMPSYKEIRINHYKNPHLGAFSVYRDNKYFSVSKDLEESAKLKDKIMSIVLNRMSCRAELRTH